MSEVSRGDRGNGTVNRSKGLKAKFAVALMALFTLLSATKANANPNQYDLSWMGMQSPQVSQVRANPRFRSPASQYDLSSLQMHSQSQTGTFGNVSRPTWSQSNALPAKRAVPLESVKTNILAQNSVDNSPIPSGKFDYGFPKTGPSAYRGAYSGQIRSNGFGGNLSQVSTSSVDINTCDLSAPFGSSTGGGGTAGGGSEPQAPPDLPPGWTGVMCHGTYAGAIPPGGSVDAFWRGEYGFAGDAAQQAALLEEGKWLLANGQIGP